MEIRDSASYQTIVLNYLDQFYYKYDYDEKKYVYETRVEQDSLTGSGTVMDFSPVYDVIVARDRFQSHPALHSAAYTPRVSDPYIVRNRHLDITSPHQSVKLGFKADDLEVFQGSDGIVEIDGSINSDTHFDDAWEVIIDLKSVFGVSAVVLLSQTDNMSQFSKRFAFKAVGVLATFLIPNNYWIGVLCRLKHNGVVNEANDILTYHFTARLTLGSGIASWVLPPKPLPGVAIVDSSKSAAEDDPEGWEWV